MAKPTRSTSYQPRQVIVGNDKATKQGRARPSARKVMIALTCTALALGMLWFPLTGLLYPHVKVTVYNETSTTICDVRILQ
jgi:hypothetical protein